jgi:hypothetical protein
MRRISTARRRNSARRARTAASCWAISGNEPPWPGREGVAVDAILAGPETPLKAAAKAFLAGGDSLVAQGVPLRGVPEVCGGGRRAIRKHDPNHLSLGLRFGSSAPPEIVRLSKVFDVYSLNNYAYKVNQTEIDKVRGLIDKPMLIGEFHFGTPGRGMTPGLKQASSQEERGVAYRYYIENALADRRLWARTGSSGSTALYRTFRRRELQHRVGGRDGPSVHRTAGGGEGHAPAPDGVHAGKEPPVTRAKVRSSCFLRGSAVMESPVFLGSLNSTMTLARAVDEPVAPRLTGNGSGVYFLPSGGP